MPPEFFRPAGPERRSRPEFEQRLYQTAISAKLSAEWQTGPGISPRKAGRKVLFCQKRRGDQAAEGGGFFEERQTDGTAAERHGKQLPQTCRPGFRGYKSRGPDRTATERGAAAGDGVQATDNRRQALDDGRRNGRRTTGGEGMGGDGRRWTAMGGDGRRWTAMDGDGRRAKEVRNGGRKTRRNTDAGGRTDKAGELPAERATGRGSYGQRELRAEGATGRQEENVRQEGRQRKERCNEDRQDSGVRRQKKQACATAGPTTRPEGRHTIFISARPEYASQRRESSYRPA